MRESGSVNVNLGVRGGEDCIRRNGDDGAGIWDVFHRIEEVRVLREIGQE